MFDHRIIADMWWALSSPPLFLSEELVDDFEWVAQGLRNETAEEHLDFLLYLDSNFDLVRGFFEGKKIKRLGLYFEQILACFIDLHPDYELILFNQQINQGKQVIGELDMVYEDKVRNEWVHLELAVKFYLGYGDTEKWSNWLGPNPIDRLDLKMNKLLGKQIHMSLHPALEEMWQKLGRKPDRKRLLLKGCLYYPEGQKANPPQDSYGGHQKSRWISFQDFLVPSQEWDSFFLLPPLDWLSPISIDGRQIWTMPTTMPNKPLHLAKYGRRGSEKERIFCVPNKWIYEVEEIQKNLRES